MLGASGTYSNKFVDSKNLFEYVFSQYDYVELMEKDLKLETITVSNGKLSDKELELITASSIGAVIHLDNKDEYTPVITLNDDISAPIQTGDVLGSVSYTIDDKTYTSELLASRDIEASKLFLYIFGFSFIFIILYIIYILFSFWISSKKRF